MSLLELFVKWDGVGERYGTLTPCHDDSFSVRRVLVDEAVERMAYFWLNDGATEPVEMDDVWQTEMIPVCRRFLLAALNVGEE